MNKTHLLYIVSILALMSIFPAESWGEETLEDKADRLIEQVEMLTQESRIANISDSLLFLIGLIIATVAICSSMYYAYLMTKQVRYQKEELKHTLRPILARREYKDINQTWLLNLGSDKHQEDKHFKIRIGNIGNTPAVNISIIRKFNLNDEDIREETKKSSMMAPGEVIDYYFKVTPDEERDILTTNRFSFDIRIKYGEISSAATDYEYYMKGHFEKADLFVDEVQTK